MGAILVVELRNRPDGGRSQNFVDGPVLQGIINSRKKYQKTYPSNC